MHVPARVANGLVEHVRVLAHPFDAAAPGADVPVGDAARAPDGGLGAPAEEDRRASGTRGRRPDLHLVEGERTTLVGEPLPGPCQPEDVDRLDRSTKALADRHAEHAELLLPPPESQPQDQAAPRDEVDGGGVLGQAQGVVEGREHHPGA